MTQEEGEEEETVAEEEDDDEELLTLARYAGETTIHTNISHFIKVAQCLFRPLSVLGLAIIMRMCTNSGREQQSCQEKGRSRYNSEIQRIPLHFHKW